MRKDDMIDTELRQNSPSKRTSHLATTSRKRCRWNFDQIEEAEFKFVIWINPSHLFSGRKHGNLEVTDSIPWNTTNKSKKDNLDHRSQDLILDTAIWTREHTLVNGDMTLACMSLSPFSGLPWRDSRSPTRFITETRNGKRGNLCYVLVTFLVQTGPRLWIWCPTNSSCLLKSSDAVRVGIWCLSGLDSSRNVPWVTERVTLSGMTIRSP